MLLRFLLCQKTFYIEQFKYNERSKKKRNKETWANELRLKMAHFEVVEGLAMFGILGS